MSPLEDASHCLTNLIAADRLEHLACVCDQSLAKMFWAVATAASKVRALRAGIEKFAHAPDELGHSVLQPPELETMGETLRERVNATTYAAPLARRRPRSEGHDLPTATVGR